MDKFLPTLPTFQTMLKGGAASFAGGAALGAGLLWYGQNHLIYPSGFPQGSRETVATPMEYNMIYHDVTLETPDSLRIKAYLMLQRREVPNTKGTYREPPIHWPAKAKEMHDVEIPIDTEFSALDRQCALNRPTVMIFHANAGNLGHRLPIARMFYEQMGCNVFMLSYRGYGLSEGSPSEKGLRIDAQTALDFILEHPILKSTKILLYGQSIGGAVAIDLASRNPDKIRGLILENTFTSIPELIPTAVPYLARVSFLCHQIWPSGESIRKIPTSTPILMLSGLKDELVPPVHMKKLWEIVTTQGGLAGEEVELDREGNIMKGDQPVEDDPEASEEKSGGRSYRRKRKGVKWWIEFAKGHHNDTCLSREYWREVVLFIKALFTNDTFDHIYEETDE